MKEKDEDTLARAKEVTQSTSDPNSGILRKGEHKVDFSYNTVYDDNNFILALVITTPNVHDSVMFEDVYNEVDQRFDLEYYVVDAG